MMFAEDIYFTEESDHLDIDNISKKTKILISLVHFLLLYQGKNSYRKKLRTDVF